MTTQSKQIIHTYCGRASSNRLPPFSQKTNNPAKSGVLSLILNALESRPKNRKRMRWNVQYFKLKMCSQCYKTSFCGKIIKKAVENISRHLLHSKSKMTLTSMPKYHRTRATTTVVVFFW